MKTASALTLIILLACASPLAFAPMSTAQSSSTTNLSLSFHAYSLVLKDPNGSLYVYDGADGAPAASTVTQVNLNSQISGTRDTFIGPVTYWSAIIMWGIKLPMDLHVQGSVSIQVYISSTAKISGVTSGGGYAMGLVDIDENNNMVQQFLTEAPYTIGNNPFTSAPTQYSLNTNIDYTFAKGHSLCFVVGLGATTQGFTATVYFGSQDRNSGATLPVAASTQTQTFTAGTDSVSITSDSAIQNFQYNSAARSISFLAQCINYTSGSCTIAIPKSLMQSPFTLTQGTQPIIPTTTESSTGYQLTFTHQRSTSTIQVTGSPASSPSQSSSPSPTGSQPQTDSPTQTAVVPTPTPPVPEFSVVALASMVVALTVAFLVAAALVLRRRHCLPSVA